MVAGERSSRSAEVLNLCFHGIGTPGRPLEADEENFWIEAAQFEELLDVVEKYPAVRLTFDDGNASDVALALPALRRRKLTAAFFVISGRIGQAGSLSAADLRSLARDGMIVGSHGLWHRPWRTVSTPEFSGELDDARAAIAAAAGQQVQQAACPFGSYDRRVLSALRSRGYSRVYTVDGGSARRDAWLQSRYTIRAQDTPADVERRARSPRGGMFPAAIRTGKSLVKQWR